MFKDRFDNLMKIFHSEEGKPLDVKALFSECLILFEELKEEMKDASPEERQDMMRLVGEMYKQILTETQKICQNSGMSEEQLIAFTENPSNFTSEQWGVIQDSRMKIHKAGQGLIKTIENKETPHKEVHAHTVQSLRKDSTKKPKKSDWRRS
jgi:hypothetical protein